MDSVECIWYGWVPTLSGKLFLPDANTVLEKSKELSLDIYRSHNVEIIINDLVSNDHLKISIKGRGVYALNSTCTIEDSGLCKISVDSSDIPDDELEVKGRDTVSMVYRFVRDIYHDHIFHTHGQPLDLAYTSDRETAVDDIIDQYRKKIVRYHHQCKNLREDLLYNELVDVGIAGLGEMRYGIAFTNTFSKTDATSAFENAYISLRGFLEQITSETMIKLSVDVKWISLGGIGLLTFFSLFGLSSTLPQLSIGELLGVAIVGAAIVVSVLDYKVG